ncbi:unnamed protein product [Psylliodes chrysocephalus]|uniref:Uncharacterized protein n=1 Tax=Psylliodes chrysocephalus TaxID=3402493 RepID=A0A9P0GC74_9CUCU|nr:unnamed protein product [Psylliodes chrysocephala]
MPQYLVKNVDSFALSVITNSCENPIRITFIEPFETELIDEGELYLIIDSDCIKNMDIDEDELDKLQRDNLKRIRFHDIRDLYGIGKKESEKTRPIIIEFIHYKLLLGILENVSNLKGTGRSFSRDYTKEEYKNRKVLYKYLKKARYSNCEARIKRNQLCIQNNTYIVTDLEAFTEEEFTAELAKFNNKPQPEIQNKKRKNEEPHVSDTVTKRITRQTNQLTPTQK